MKLQETTYAAGNATLEELTRRLRDEGYGGQVIPLEGGEIRCATCDVTSPAGTVTIEALHRAEGASDPGDEAAVIAMRCPACNVGASLVLTYGPNASGADADVLVALPDPPPPPEAS